MKRLEILCPKCMKKKLLQIQTESTKCFCDSCGTNFILVSTTTVRYA